MIKLNIKIEEIDGRIQVDAETPGGRATQREVATFRRLQNALDQLGQLAVKVKEWEHRPAPPLNN